jgi:hypothetical protein
MKKLMQRTIRKINLLKRVRIRRINHLKRGLKIRKARMRRKTQKPKVNLTPSIDPK